jgi:hypothetical protein
MPSLLRTKLSGSYYKSFGEEKRERAEAKSDPKRKRGRPAQGKKADQENLPLNQ